jgi:hypothetical protein
MKINSLLYKTVIIPRLKIIITQLLKEIPSYIIELKILSRVHVKNIRCLLALNISGQYDVCISYFIMCTICPTQLGFIDFNHTDYMITTCVCR